MTGATGYLGRPLTSLALARGHRVRVLVRPGSESRVAAGAAIITGDPFSPEQLAAVLSPDDTLVHLIGTPRPSPAKAQQFLDVDLASIRAAAAAAARTRITHIVYVSVAHPAPMMKAYIAARMQGEDAVRATGIPATILRPWYVLGPGHWWPYALLPIYKVLEHVPSIRDGALRLGLVTRRQMITALMRAIEDGPAAAGVRDVGAIRTARVVASSG
jgi:nucleoside-diphosphate-sugar epimerase